MDYLNWHFNCSFIEYPHCVIQTIFNIMQSRELEAVNVQEQLSEILYALQGLRDSKFGHTISLTTNTPIIEEIAQTVNQLSEKFQKISHSQQKLELMNEQLKEEIFKRLLQEERFKLLLESMTLQGSDIRKRIRGVLQLGAKALNMEIGISSRIDEENDEYTIYAVYHPDNLLQAGHKFPFKRTFCEVVYRHQEVLTIDHAAQSAYSSHPCYLDLQMESFIGTQIIVEGEPYGTLNFTSPQPRRIPFNESDKVYIELMGKWVAKMMELDLQQKRLIQQNNELSNVNEQLDSFVYTVSHDLKLPAINVTNMIQILKGRIQVEDPMGIQALEILEKSGNQLQRTVEDLLTVSRIKHTAIQYEEIALKGMLSNILEGFKNTIEKTNIVVHVHIEKCKTIYFSPPYLRSILQNLISNSIKYRSYERKPMVYIEAYQTNSHRVIEVTDNGIGMDLSKGTEKLFAMFKRLHDHVEGSGVGMHIVKKIMDKYKGTIEVESVEGQGTMVRLKFRNTMLESFN